MTAWWHHLAACPACGARLAPGAAALGCPGCGAGYPVTDGQVRFTAPKGHSVERDPVPPPRRQWSWLREHSYCWLEGALAGVPAGAAVLDLGCGPGQFHALLAPHRVIGLDVQPYGAVAALADLDGRLPLVDGAVDIVIMSHVLEHLFDPAAALGEVHRVLAPGGRLLMMTPFLIKLHQTPFDYGRPTEFWYRRALARVGFAEIAVTPIGGLFEVHDLVKWARDQALRGHSTGWRRHAVRRLIQGQNALERLLGRVAAPLRAKPPAETAAYPHGYGVAARKGAA